jgi:hypothetical protein
MKTNVGTVDRILRILAGCAILAAGGYFRSWWGLVGILPLLTGIFRFCPAYLPLGMSTCPKPTDKP